MFGIRAGRFPCGRMESSWQREFLPLWFARLLANVVILMGLARGSISLMMIGSSWFLQAYRARNVASLTASWSLLAQEKSCH